MKSSKQELIAYLQNHTLVKHPKLVNNSVLWVIQGHSGGSFLVAFELVQEENSWRHVGHSEASTPPYTHCPPEFLELTPVKNSDWRNKVLLNKKRVRTFK